MPALGTRSLAASLSCRLGCGRSNRIRYRLIRASSNLAYQARALKMAPEKQCVKAFDSKAQLDSAFDSNVQLR